MSLVRRSAERNNHAYEKEIYEALNIVDLGGLLIGKNDMFTAAVEAFTGDAANIDKTIVNSHADLEPRLTIAEQIGVPFYVLYHSNGASSIIMYRLSHDAKRSISAEPHEVDEETFLQWWKQHKQTTQTKQYQPAFIDRTAHSYFDQLLESNDSKWGGNIDGFILRDANNHILGVVENRYTNKAAIAEYDPNHYFAANGGDRSTWKPLIKLADLLRVPLFLFTFSNRWGEEHINGAARIVGMTSYGIHYETDADGNEIRPCDNLMHSVQEVRQWLARYIAI